jgi:hypothetical protein
VFWPGSRPFAPPETQDAQERAPGKIGPGESLCVDDSLREGLRIMSKKLFLAKRREVGAN